MLGEAMYRILRGKPYATKTVKVHGKRLKLELADTFAKKMIGLMYRQDMGKMDGMLFLISSPGIISATITMMNMRFNIDIVWLDANKKVVDIAANAEPSPSIFASYKPKRAAAYVIELGAGRARKLGIKVHDRLAFS